MRNRPLVPAVDGRTRASQALQTSEALGAAAAQLGPDAQAAAVELNKQGGLSHGKVTQCLKSLFGIPLSRGRIPAAARELPEVRVRHGRSRPRPSHASPGRAWSTYPGR